MLAIRYPSLLRGSMFIVYIDEIKTDIEDRTLSVFAPTVIQANGDFDGDEFSGYLIIDKYMYDLMKPFETHFNTLDNNKVRKISSVVSMPKPVVTNINNYLRDASKFAEASPEEQQRMVELLGA